MSSQPTHDISQCVPLRVKGCCKVVSRSRDLCDPNVLVEEGVRCYRLSTEMSYASDLAEGESGVLADNQSTVAGFVTAVQLAAYKISNQISAFAGPRACNDSKALEDCERKLSTMKQYIRMNEEDSDQLELLVELQTLVRCSCSLKLAKFA